MQEWQVLLMVLVAAVTAVAAVGAAAALGTVAQHLSSRVAQQQRSGASCCFRP